MNKIVSLFVVVCFLVSGCASIVSKSSYPVTIISNPDQASITITDERGTQIYKGRTPSTLTLKAGEPYFHGKDYAVTFEKNGYEKQVASIHRGLDGWYIGNILFGGLIGFLIVDPLTGAMWKLDSPLTVTLVEKTASLESNGAQLQIVTIDDVPQHLIPNMVRVK